jgi:hypothetical protein
MRGSVPMTRTARKPIVEKTIGFLPVKEARTIKLLSSLATTPSDGRSTLQSTHSTES